MAIRGPSLSRRRNLLTGMSQPQMVNLYRAAKIGPTVASLAGSTAAQLGISEKLRRDSVRASLLAQDVKSGLLPSSSISSTDQALMSSVFGGGSGVNAAIGKPPGAHGVFGLLGNLFGDKGVWGALTHLPGGIATLGSSVVHDITHPGSMGAHYGGHGGSQTQKRVINPLIQQYKYQYGPLVHGDVGEFAHRLYEHPLGPILDVATLASGGLGAAGRFADVGINTGRVGRAFSREGLAARAPVAIKSEANIESLSKAGVETPEVTRPFSNRPLVHLMQEASDRLVQSRVGARPLPLIDKSLQGMQESRVVNKFADTMEANRVLAQQAGVAHLTRGLVNGLNHLSPAETTSLHLALRGINTEPRFAAMQTFWRNSLEGKNPVGHNIGDTEYFNEAQIPREHVEYLANLPEHVKELAMNPTPAMKAVADTWSQLVEDLRKEQGIPDEIHVERQFATQKDLAHAMGNDAPSTQSLLDEAAIRGEHNENFIHPQYTPDVASEGMKFHTPRRLEFLDKVPGLQKKSGEPFLTEGRFGGRRISRIATTPENVLRAPFQAYLKESDLGTLHSGAIRTDAKVFLNHITQRIRDELDVEFAHGGFDQMALKDPDGELAKFKTQAQVDRATGGKGDWLLIHPEVAVRWFRGEENVLKKVLDRIDELKGEGHPVGTTGISEDIQGIMEEYAQDFVTHEMGAQKTFGYAVPRHFFDRLKAIQEGDAPLERALGTPYKLYKRFINSWRTLTLAFMPRWWVNTVVGTSFLNLLKGVWNPRDYYRAFRLMQSGRAPAGVELGGFAMSEHLQNGTLAHSWGTTRAAYNLVQKSEDYFRTASFVQSLRKAERRHMTEIGDVVKTFIPMSENVNEWIDRMLPMGEDALKNPIVRDAIEEVNRFAYNYNSLGVIERNYVRQFIPFWGWYKFITKLSWKLPVEYPGRARIIMFLGKLGQDAEDQFPGLPEWAKGAIFLNNDPKHLMYLSTKGLNPFGQYATPFGDEGTIGGLIRMGQFNPFVQATLSGMGVDPLTGDRSKISPQSGVAENFIGQLYDTKTGEPTSIGEHEGLKRFAMTLLREFPQFRIAEPFFTKGQPVYPESVPLFAPRPMGVRPETRKKYGFLPTGLQYLGLSPHITNLSKQQAYNRKSSKYAGTRNRRQLRTIERRSK